MTRVGVATSQSPLKVTTPPPRLWARILLDRKVLLDLYEKHSKIRNYGDDITGAKACESAAAVRNCAILSDEDPSLAHCDFASTKSAAYNTLAKVEDARH